MEVDIEQYLSQNQECFDRFTFDKIFRFLLEQGLLHEEAKDLILFNCSLSAIIFQERIDNNYYQSISVSETISEDLRQLMTNTFIEKLHKLN